MNVGVWAVVVLVVEGETTIVVGGGDMVVVVVGGLLVVADGGVVVVDGGVVAAGIVGRGFVVGDIVTLLHPMIEVINTKLNTTRGKPEYLLFINALPCLSPTRTFIYAGKDKVKMFPRDLAEYFLGPGIHHPVSCYT